MRDFRLRTDLDRVVVNGFALPLGIAGGVSSAPTPGFTVTYNHGENDDEPDTYAFHIVVSHEHIPTILANLFQLLPDEVFPIVEIGSRDAYRSVDVFLAAEPQGIDRFVSSWMHYEPILLEDGAIAAGVNSEEPFIEIFVDQWKGIHLHVQPFRQEEIADRLESLGLVEVAETWPQPVGDSGLEVVSRPVLEIVDEHSPDIDEFLLMLRADWQLELNIDPVTNVDEGGRNLGLTLWHAVVILRDSNGRDDRGAYAEAWVSAGSLYEAESLIHAGLDGLPDWAFDAIYTIDRVAFDDRPEELGHLPPRLTRAELHQLEIDPWEAPPPPPESKRRS